MLFNSLAFFIFFPTVCVAFFLLPHRFRWLLLLVASSYFYMSFVPAYLLILAALIVVDYFVGLLLEKTGDEKQRKILLIVSIVVNIGLLFVFKYYNFFNTNLTALADALHWNYALPALEWALPLGLSFHTFQSLSYIVEVYRKNQKAERNFGIYALYVMFFPQLVAGPIERPQHMLHQFHEVQTLDVSRIGAGLRLMGWGFFKKLVIADTVAVYVNHVFAAPQSFQGIAIALAIFLFAFQIYTDFSGYTDIARGSARVLGFRLMENFDRPYASRSISEFWRCWHISLCSWLRDYVYIPLGGSRTSEWKWVRNILITFLLSGLWHGANWTYVLWGALHGFYVIMGVQTAALRKRIVAALLLSRVPRIHGAIQSTYIFFLVCIAWIFFRATSLSDVQIIFTRILQGWSLNDIPFSVLDGYQWASLALAIAVLLSREWLPAVWERFATIQLKHAPLRIAVAYGALMWILFFGYFSESPFIYFQF